MPNSASVTPPRAGSLSGPRPWINDRRERNSDDHRSLFLNTDPSRNHTGNVIDEVTDKPSWFLIDAGSATRRDVNGADVAGLLPLELYAEAIGLNMAPLKGWFRVMFKRLEHDASLEFTSTLVEATLRRRRERTLQWESVAR
jgi:hypothetical protein